MLINSQKLIGLRAETQSGQYIGRIQSFDIDIDTQSARNYYIKPSLLEGGVFSGELKVHHRQVVDISERKMVVLDNVVKYKEKASKRIFVGTGAGVG
jgi:sporulation protein YlmC with PRC-barrel domain